MNIVILYDAIKTVCTLILVALSFIFFAPIVTVMMLLPASIRYDNRWYYWFMSLWCRYLLWSTFIKYSVEGAENIPSFAHDPAVIVVNHSSSLDIPVVDMLIGSYPHVWLSKNYGSVPFLNFILRRMHVQVSALAMRRSLDTVKTMLQLVTGHKRHVVIFPEGRRYDDGQIHPLYSGFAVFAEQLQRPVIPIVIVGLHAVYPKHSFFVRSTRSCVKIIVGKPIYRNESESREEFVDKVSNWFKLEHKQIVEPLQ